MKHLIYITHDSWWDTDITVLPSLAKKYDVDVYCLSPRKEKLRKFPIKTLPQSIRLHDYQFEKSKKNPLMMILSVWYGFVLLFASRNNLTIWVVKDNIYYGLPFVLFSQKKQVIITIHNYVEHIDAKKWYIKWKKFVFSKFHYFHFYSKNQELLFKKDYPNGLSFSTNMPLKDFGKPKEMTSLFPNKKRTFLFFGGIRSYKRPDLFIMAANKLKDKANFVIAGNCNNWQKYMNMIDKDNPILCHIRYIENDEIPYYFIQSDFLVLPYDDSTQSGPLLIAYQYNIPIIASSLPYFEEMIDEKKSGRIFVKGSLGDLVNAIHSSIEMTKDEYDRMKMQMKQKSNQYIKDCDFSVGLDRFVSAYLK